MYAIEMGSRAIIYIPSFIKINSWIEELIRGDSQEHRQHDGVIILLLFLACFPYLKK
jgi:hypothetical protein